MCVIGFKCTGDDSYLFKNRDLLPGEAGNNYISDQDGVLLFKDKRYDGAWAGVSRYGVCIVESYAAPIDDAKAGKSDSVNSFKIIEHVLRNSTNLDQAFDMFDKRLFNGIDLHPAHILIADRYRAKKISFDLGACLKDSYEYDDFITLTNHHIGPLSALNPDYEKIGSSVGRLRTAEDRIIDARTLQDFKNMLRSHGDSSLCVHEGIPTTGSVIFELGDSVKAHFVLNGTPCNQEYEVAVIE